MSPSSILDTIGHPRLLVLGDLILDRYTWGDAERVSPEAPVLVLRVDTKEVRLGGAASVAMLLRGLEAEVTLAGVVGDDPEGRTLLALLADEHIPRSQAPLGNAAPEALLRVDAAAPACGLGAPDDAKQSFDTPRSQAELGNEKVVGGHRPVGWSRVPSAVDFAHSLVIVDPSRPTTTKERFVGRAANRHPHQILRVDHETRQPIGTEIEECLLQAIIARLDETAAGAESGGPAACVAPAGSRSDKRPRPAHPSEAELRRTPFPSGAWEREKQAGFDAVLISDYSKGVCTPRLLQGVIAAANQRGIPVIIDPARIGDYSRYRGATLLKPNRVEAELATGAAIGTPEDALVAAEKLREQFQVQAVLVTLDRDGMALVEAASCHFPRSQAPLGNAAAEALLRVTAPTRADPPAPTADAKQSFDTARSQAELGNEGGLGNEGELGNEEADSPITRHHFPTQPRTVYDITGAGDMVLAALGLCLASGISLAESVHVANAAAGLEVEKLGVTPVTRAELSRALPPLARGGQGGSLRRPTDSQASNVRTSHSSPKFVSLSELVEMTSAYRLSGKTLVFTNGCFDLLHIGHVTCLQEAAAIGDVLIVAINSDASVRRLKGPGRPVVGEHERAALVAALDCVDHVLIFDEPTPHRLLEAIRPNLLVKGGTTASIVGQEVVESYGGRVCRVGERPGVSTSRILSRINERGPDDDRGGDKETGRQGEKEPLPTFSH